MWDNCWIWNRIFSLGIVLLYLVLSWKFYARRVISTYFKAAFCSRFSVHQKLTKGGKVKPLWDMWVETGGETVCFSEQGHHGPGHMLDNMWASVANLLLRLLLCQFSEDQVIIKCLFFFNLRTVNGNTSFLWTHSCDSSNTKYRWT